jgi:hypothetical protein
MGEAIYQSEGWSKRKWIGVCLLIIVCLTVGANFFTGFLKWEWLPINPEEDFDKDNMINRNDPFPFDVDGDGDGFLDGYNIQSTVGSNTFNEFSESGIVYYEDLDGNVTFFGEEDVGGNSTHSDNGLAFRFREHLEYLSELSPEMQREMINRGELLDRDPDKDYMDTAFEVNVAGLNPYVKNDRYIISIHSHPKEILTPPLQINRYLVPFEPIDPVGNHSDESRYILMKNKFQYENIFTLIGNEATFENFKILISDISPEIGPEDITFIQFVGHGNSQTYFTFNDGKGGDSGTGPHLRKFEEIDEILDKINSKMVIAIGTCGRIELEYLHPLEEGLCQRVLIDGWSLLKYTDIAAGSWKTNRLDKYVGDMDSNKDGHISIKEHYTFLTSMPEPEGSPDSIILDRYGIASELYFGDANVEELKELN